MYNKNQDNQYKDNNQNKDNIEETDNNERKTVFNLDKNEWGNISAVVNFISVVFQLRKTVSTGKAKSFSMKYIGLMTYLNFVYVLIGILTQNMGMTIACGIFVIYNFVIIYYYYFGQQISNKKQMLNAN